jgi:hypothetical protein
MPSLILAAFVLAHGAIHLSYLAPPPPATADGPTWPFTLDRSWVLSRAHASTAVLRSIGLALTAVTFASFTLAAMAIVGVVPQTLAPVAVVLGAGSSIGLLMLFFHPWLVLGLVIDVASLWAVIVAEWSPIAA